MGRSSTLPPDLRGSGAVCSPTRFLRGWVLRVRRQGHTDVSPRVREGSMDGCMAGGTAMVQQGGVARRSCGQLSAAQRRREWLHDSGAAGGEVCPLRSREGQHDMAAMISDKATPSNGSEVPREGGLQPW